MGTLMLGGGGSRKSVQVKPGSMVQAAEQPSPETTLPSSHSSPAACRVMPSPHLGWHAPVGSQTKMFSISQAGLQPSPATGAQGPGTPAAAQSALEVQAVVKSPQCR